MIVGYGMTTRDAMNMTPYDENPLLNNVRRHRKIFWLWLPIGFSIEIITTLLISYYFGEPPEWVFTALNVGWGVIATILLIKLSNVRCPRCGNKALRSPPLVTTKYVRCQWCDYPKKE
jgi:DNA-directed RNA polymerase subunit RPC12/RpoP